MCQQIIQFCSFSTRAILLAASLISLLLAIAIGYTGCTSNALYNDISPEVASTKSLSYLLQLGATCYLVLITLFSCSAAYYEQKHSIRALTIISALNFFLALLAIVMLPSGKEIGQLLEPTLKQAALKYDFKDKGQIERKLSLELRGQLEKLDPDSSEPTTLNSTGKNVKRAADEPAKVAPEPVRELNGTQATRIWDRLQARGCCGIFNGTTEWKSRVPKSCCLQPTLDGEETRCKEIDAGHQRGCMDLIYSTTTFNLTIVLALVAVLNFLLEIVAGISAFRTFHYDEASQNAYS